MVNKVRGFYTNSIDYTSNYHIELLVNSPSQAAWMQISQTDNSIFSLQVRPKYSQCGMTNLLYLHGAASLALLPLFFRCNRWQGMLKGALCLQYRDKIPHSKLRWFSPLLITSGLKSFESLNPWREPQRIYLVMAALSSKVENYYCLNHYLQEYCSSLGSPSSLLA